MQNEMYVAAVVQVRSLYLKQVGGVTQHQLVLMHLRFLGGFVEDMV